MKIEQLQEQYKNVPQELKTLKRWVCFKIENIDGENKKMPINAINGNYAKSNDNLTWTRFNLALNGCVKYNCDGIGFMLGDGIFGVDLDDGAFKKLKKGLITQEEYLIERECFDNVIEEFVNGLNSYSEKSISKKGIHIICYGKLPEGRRRCGDVEMYDSGRFFAFTGDAIKNIPIQERSEEIISLWQKYVNKGQPAKEKKVFVKPDFEYDDEVLIKKIEESTQGEKFKALMSGDIDTYNNGDHSSADSSLCNILAFWTAKNKEQMDRIFRNSDLYREKWDEMRGSRTYGEMTISASIDFVEEVYDAKKYAEENQPSLPSVTVNKKRLFLNEKTGEIVEDFTPNMNIDKNGEPIFRIKKIFKNYTLDDTGNANRFYDYFGKIFKYNVTDKTFMFWTGKTWIKDEKDIVKKYANKLIEIMRDEADSIEQNILKLTTEGNANEAKMQEKFLDAFRKNITRVSNKAGKEAMLSELKVLKDIPVTSDEFNKQEFLLNTENGIVNLLNGEIMPFDSTKMLSKNTNTKISFEEPKNWINFLYSIFYRGDEEKDKKETEEIVKFIKRALGYSLSGSTREQAMFLLYGSGSNGKSTFTEQVAYMMGSYADSIASSVLMQQKNPNNSAVYSIAKLKNIRLVSTGETDEGGKFAEGQIKSLTGGDMISAQFKYGNEFSYKPEFKIWMSTNNKPIIRGTDFGIWRRIFPIPFLRRFEKKEKDRMLPEKLRAESDKILGWCIQGFLEYQQLEEGLQLPTCLEKEKNAYKAQMDVVSQFIEKECYLEKGYRIHSKALYQNYKAWAMDNTEYIMKQSKFEEELLNRGIKARVIDKERYYLGIRMGAMDKDEE